jgi:hypothetical protein
MPAFPVVDVDEWEVVDYEPMGSKPGKLWLQPPAGSPFAERRWLFKPTTIQRERDREFLKGDDWAEKLVAEVAHLLGVSAAPVELATRRGSPGIISGDISARRELVFGNEVLFGHDPEYDRHGRRGVAGYTVDAVLSALRSLGVVLPADHDAPDASAAFAGYVTLDALVANTDRHHENWGILVDPTATEPPCLAPSFDHASSLGFLLSDDERAERLQTRDGNRTVEAFAERGRSRHFAGTPTLVDVAVNAAAACGAAVAIGYRSRVEALSHNRLEALLDSIPDDRMSHPSRIFAVRLMDENRRRLLDELNRYG